MTPPVELFEALPIPPLSGDEPEISTRDSCTPELLSLPGTRRIMVANETAVFPNLSAETEGTPLHNPDEERKELQRILIGRNYFNYVTENTSELGGLLGDSEIRGQLHLCFGETADSAGNYPVYAYDWTANPVLSHTCPTAMSPVQIRLSDGEILRIVNDNQIGNPDYCVEPGSGNGFQGGLLFYLRANPFDERDILRIADNVAANPNLSPTRRQEIAGAIRPLADAAIRQRETSEKMDRMVWIMVPSMLIPAYIAARASGMTDRLDSFLVNSARAVWDTPGSLVRGDFSTFWRQWSDVFRPRNPVLTDLTERLTTLNVPLTDGSRQVLEGFDRGQMSNVIFGGPSGAGKGYSTEAAFALALQGQSGVEAFEGMRLHAYRISVGAIVERAGSWLNGGEKEFLRALKQVPDGSLVQLTEADQLARCGMGPGNEPLNLLPRLYNIMEQRPGLFFVLESTRWQTIEANAPDLLRRTAFAEILPPLPQELRQMLEAGVRMRQNGDQGPVLQRRYKAFTFTSQALDAVAALGAYERGAPPSSHLMVMDQVMAEVARSRRDGSGGTEITQDDVIRYVARGSNSSEDQVRRNLQGLLEGGIENNPRIGARIVEGFYRAYPTPRSGFVNPLRPNPNPAFIMHDGERIDLPAGSYATAREAVHAGNPTASPAVATVPGNGAVAPRLVRTGWEEVLTYRVNDRAIYDALVRVDRGLAQYYRENLSPAGRTISTMGELVEVMRWVNPAILDQALTVATMEGRPVSQIPERAVFEIVARSAEGRGAFTDGDLTARMRMAERFETEVRSRNGIDGTEGRPAVDPAEQERQRGRRRRVPVEGR